MVCSVAVNIGSKYRKVYCDVLVYVVVEILFVWGAEQDRPFNFSAIYNFYILNFKFVMVQNQKSHSCFVPHPLLQNMRGTLQRCLWMVPWVRRPLTSLTKMSTNLECWQWTVMSCACRYAKFSHLSPNQMIITTADRSDKTTRQLHFQNPIAPNGTVLVSWLKCFATQLLRVMCMMGLKINSFFSHGMCAEEEETIQEVSQTGHRRCIKQWYDWLRCRCV